MCFTEPGVAGMNLFKCAIWTIVSVLKQILLEILPQVLLKFSKIFFRAGYSPKFTLYLVATVLIDYVCCIYSPPEVTSNPDIL